MPMPLPSSRSVCIETSRRTILCSFMFIPWLVQAKRKQFQEKQQSGVAGVPFLEILLGGLSVAIVAFATLGDSEPFGLSVV